MAEREDTELIVIGLWKARQTKSRDIGVCRKQRSLAVIRVEEPPIDRILYAGKIIDANEELILSKGTGLAEGRRSLSEEGL